MDKIVVPRDNGPDLRFAGERIALAVSHPDPNDPSTSRALRYSELALFRTETGRYVCLEIGHSRVAGEVTRHKAEVVDSHQAVIEFFGLGWLAKKLYRQAGIDAAVDV